MRAREEVFEKWYSETSDTNLLGAFNAGADYEVKRRNQEQLVSRVILIQETDLQRLQNKINHFCEQGFFLSGGIQPLASPRSVMAFYLAVMQWAGKESEAPTVDKGVTT